MRSLGGLWLPDEHHEVVGPPLEGVEIVVGHAEGVGDDRERQRHGELLHQLDVAVVDEGVDQVLGDVADRVLDLADPRRGEGPVHQVALAGVGRRVGAQQHRDPAAHPTAGQEAPDLLRLLGQLGEQPAELDDGVGAGRHLRAERLGIADDLDDVAVAGHEVDAGLLHEVHRRLRRAAWRRPGTGSGWHQDPGRTAPGGRR